MMKMIYLKSIMEKSYEKIIQPDSKVTDSGKTIDVQQAIEFLAREVKCPLKQIKIVFPS